MQVVQNNINSNYSECREDRHISKVWCLACILVIIYLVGTQCGSQHGLAKSYASKLVLSLSLSLSTLPLFVVADFSLFFEMKCPMHGLHDE